jgi:hypothetical protein
MPLRILSSRVPACLGVVLALMLASSLVGCGTNADTATTSPPPGISLSGAVTGTITSVGSCPPQRYQFASQWTATFGGAPYTLTVGVDDAQPNSTFDAGAANGYGTRVTLARVGTSTVYDSTALLSEEAGRVSFAVNGDTGTGVLYVMLKDTASNATVRATGSWTCQA